MAVSTENISDLCVIESIQIGGQIGKGKNATISEAKWEGLRVAIKDTSFVFDQINEGEIELFRENFLSECKIASHVRHPNIVCFLGIYFFPSAKVPCIIMELLHCDLNGLLERHPVIPLEIELHILHGIGLGLRYLHMRDLPIIHKDLTSKNVLLSEGIEVKISDLCAARLFNSVKVSHSLDFLPSVEVTINEMGKEVDVFSFGCIMIHTFSHQWPTPSEATVTSNDPDMQAIANSSSELDRRMQYVDKVPKTIEDVMVPLITSCLEDHPMDRPSAEEVCDQLETLVVNRKCHLPDNLLEAQLVLQQTQKQVEHHVTELHEKEAELQSKRSELQSQADKLQSVKLEVCRLKLETSELQLLSDVPPRNASKSSINFQKSITLTWKQSAKLPLHCFVTSVAELAGKVYVSVKGSECAYLNVLAYIVKENRWYDLPPLPHARFSLCTIPSRKQLFAIGGVKVSFGVVNVSNAVFSWEESDYKWVSVYPDMPTSRWGSSCIGHQSTAVVAGGVTCLEPFIITRAVEILHVGEEHISDSYWSVAERLPHIVYDAIPLVVNDTIYIAAGNDRGKGGSICSMITASLPDLLLSASTSVTADGQVWNKLPDMPYCSYAINHYEGYLITFTGDCMVELPDEDNAVCKLVPLMHLYNPDTSNWDYVGNITHGYYLGRSIHLSPNKFLFIGGLTGKHYLGDSDDIVSDCLTLTITEASRS